MENLGRGDTLEGIAIIGMSGRFPGAKDTETLWKNLLEGRESIARFSDNELHPRVSHEITSKEHYVRARGILDGIELFDEAFFRMSPREAEIMDPQHRLFLELSWEALEDAGYNPESFDGLIGVYGGAGINTYLAHNLLTNRELIQTVGEHQIYIANAPDYITSRVAYKLNFKGPAVSVYTSCSSSLVAVCLAFEALNNYHCDIALAGGVFVHCPQESGYLYQEGEIFSSDGRCRPFDSAAQGTVFSNGGGIVALKRYEEALEDGDCIYAVIRSAAINNDGSDKVSFLAPSVSGQAEVIATAHANAGINPETISYVEAHGTGTPVGDPIEIEALTQAYQLKTRKEHFCAIGSIKGNIGHLDAAAGVAGLIKTALILHHGIIPPSINFEQPNPNIDLIHSPFYVNTAPVTWDTNDHPRRAGVSSFGVGGTNAHVILEEPPTVMNRQAKRSWEVLLLSAMSPPALERVTERFIGHRGNHPDLRLSDAAYTLAVGRKHFTCRRMVVCQDWNDALETLQTPLGYTDNDSVLPSRRREIAFMFSGQGSQYPSMGYEIYQTETAFREAIDQCAETLLPHLECDVRDILFPPPGDSEDASSRLRNTYYAQPALFTIEYALATLLMSWGITPQALVGHSIGEYVAACLAGVFSLEEALTIVAFRGAIMSKLPEAAMVAVFLPEHELTSLLDEGLSVAAVNAPAICSVSGQFDPIESLKERLNSMHIDWRDLHTSHAFHSSMVEPILDEFIDRVKQADLRAPHLPFLSNVTGTWITPEEATNPGYWGKHLREHVRFSACVRELQKTPGRVFMEVGPGRTLSALVKLHLKDDDDQVVLSCIRHPQEHRSDMAFLLHTIGELWACGGEINWERFYGNEKRQRVALPTYPFDRKRRWIDTVEHTAITEPAVPSPSLPQEHPASSRRYAVNQSPSSVIQPELKKETNQDIASVLTKIWKDLLGVKKVGMQDNFFDLGGSSVIAAMLFSEIESRLGKKLPLATLYAAPTIEQLSGIIESQRQEARWTSLVAIQPHGSKPPLFLVHGAGGNVLLYRDLSRRLGAEQPVYGLQSQGLDGDTPFYTTIQDMAAHYLREIRMVQPQGPYLLGGYCLGGTIALEIAQQLLHLRQRISLLVLLETYNFSNIPHQTSLKKLYAYLEKIEFHLRNFLLLRPSEKLVFLIEKVKVAHSRKGVLLGMIASRVLPGRAQRGNGNWAYLSALWNLNDRAALAYQPRMYPGKITQIIPIKEYSHHRGPQLGWEALAAEVETHQLSIYPGGMLIEPFVATLAETLTNCIDAALNKSKGAPTTRQLIGMLSSSRMP